MNKLLFLFSLITSIIFVIPYSVKAEGDFMVTPAKMELELKPGTKTSFDISITNRTGRTATFLLGAEDITSEENGDVKLLGMFAGSFPLKDYIKASFREIEINDGEKSVVSITVDLPVWIKDPGLYGAVTITLLNPASVGGNARIQTQIGVPILVSTGLQAKVVGRIDLFDTLSGRKIIFSGPVDLKISYSNEGDLHLRPGGIIEITNLFGMKSEPAIVGPWFVLPGSTRSILTTLGTPYSFGRYALGLTINNGVDNKLENAKLVVWVLPWRILLAIFAGLVVLYVLLRMFGLFEIKFKNTWLKK